MKSNLKQLLIVSSLVAVSGCAASTSSDANAKPEQVVERFLEAVRTGDDEMAGGLLTPLAQQKTSESQMVVSPPGSATARFEIGEATFANGRASVVSLWTDNDPQGVPHTDRIVWHLRRERMGWRISGMSTQVFPDQDAIELSFEDPQDMIRKQQQAEEEMARRESLHNRVRGTDNDRAPFQR